jgi:hypothetical protein
MVACGPPMSVIEVTVTSIPSLDPYEIVFGAATYAGTLGEAGLNWPSLAGGWTIGAGEKG